MPRSIINKVEADLLNDLIIANVQQAIYQDNATNFLVMRAEATQKFIAIPPIQAPDGSYSQSLLYPGIPVAVELYRDQEFYIAFNSVVTSQSGWIPGGALKLISLNPGMVGSTLAVTAVTGTNPLRVNWVQ